MTTYKLSAFAGEAPSVSDRALGANYARANFNLFLPSNEFRPLRTDRRHSACLQGALSLHRFHRNASGEVIQDPNAAIRSYAQELSFVKGQINDEATERTYQTTNDGSARPRAIDTRGNDRLLGVVRPVKPVIAAQVVDEFTPEEADNWMYGDFADAIRADILATVIPHEGNALKVRWGNDGKSYAGVSQNYDLTLPAGIPGSNPSMLYAVVTAERASKTGMNTTKLGALSHAGGWAIPVSAAPYAYPFRWEELEQALVLHQFPDTSGDRSGEAVFTAAQAGKLVDAIKGYVAPKASATKLRDELDSLVKEFAALALTKSWDVPASAPVRPKTPTSPQWITTGGGDSQLSTENPEWIEYRAAMDRYNEALEKYANADSNAKSQADSLNARMVEIQQKTATIVASIGTQLGNQFTALIDGTAVVGDMLTGQGGVSGIVGDGLVERVVDSRFYVVAFVTDWGEESEPSPITDMVEVDANDTVTITRPGAMTGEALAARNVKLWRIYRSNTSTTAAAWQLVAELDVGVGQFLDDKASEELDSLQPQFTWTAPPYRMDAQYESENKPTSGVNPFLRGLVGMPNGIMAGFIDNTVAFCEPYVPYAWPVDYQITTEYPVVGFGVFDQTLFVGTTGNPYLITGAHSASMTAIKLDSNQSCSARRSIVGVQGGVLYASPDGLCLAGQGGVEVVTRTLINRDEWQALQPASMFAVEHEGVYYLFYRGGGGGCLAFSLKDGWKLGHVDLSGTAAWVDKFNDLMYVASGTDLMECYTGAALRVGRWKTGVATQGAQSILAWAKVYGDQTPANPITVRLWGDGELRHTATFTNLQPQRLPPGRWLEHQVEVEGAARATAVVLCSTSDELKAI